MRYQTSSSVAALCLGVVVFLLALILLYLLMIVQALVTTAADAHHFKRSVVFSINLPRAIRLLLLLFFVVFTSKNPTSAHYRPSSYHLHLYESSWRPGWVHCPPCPGCLPVCVLDETTAVISRFFLCFRPLGMFLLLLLLLLQWRRRAHPRLSLVLVMLGGFVVTLLPMSAILIGVTR